jgi:hypothetical protein
LCRRGSPKELIVAATFGSITGKKGETVFWLDRENSERRSKHSLTDSAHTLDANSRGLAGDTDISMSGKIRLTWKIMRRQLGHAMKPCKIRRKRGAWSD